MSFTSDVCTCKFERVHWERSAEKRSMLIVGLVLLVCMPSKIFSTATTFLIVKANLNKWIPEKSKDARKAWVWLLSP